MDNTREIWKDIEGFDGKYMVSNMGQVLSKNYKRRGYSQVIKQQLNNCGYCTVNLRDGDRNSIKFVHRLVLMAFNPIDNCEELQADHINNNRTDNRLSNLRWSTQQANNSRLHARRMRSKNSRKGLNFTTHYIKMEKDGEVFIVKNQSEAAHKIGCCTVLVSKVLGGTDYGIHKAKGWTLTYIPKSECPEFHSKIQNEIYEKMTRKSNILKKQRQAKNELKIKLEKEVKMERIRLEEELQMKLSEYRQAKSNADELYKEVEALRKQVLGMNFKEQKWQLHAVCQYTMEGELVKEWRSVSDVKKELGLDVNYCVKGFKESAGGYVWKYKISRD